MKRILSIIFCVCFAAVANGAMTVSGNYTAVDSKMFMDLIVTETGVMNATRSEFFKVTVKGEAALDRCIMRKEVISYAVLVANATEFLKDLSVYSGDTTLTSSNLQNLKIMDSDEGDINVILAGATIVNGSIIFETGQGKVFAGPNVVVKGEIIGGSLIDLPQ